MKEVIISQDLWKKLLKAEKESPAKVNLWDDEKDEVLKHFYGKIETKELGKLIGKTPNQIWKRASFLGVSPTK